VDGVSAAVALAHRLGFVSEGPVPLRSTNNTVVWLRPSLVVAKVFRSRTTAARELAIGHELAARGAPIVSPVDVVGAEVHEFAGWFLTFLRYVPQDDAAFASSEELAVALHTLHLALAPLAEVMLLPSLESRLRDAIHALDEPRFAPALVGCDRALLRETLVAKVADLRNVPMSVIHGSPHDMNILMDGGQPVFIDLETVQWGPVEWDLAHLSPDVARHYPAPCDDQVLTTARIAVSAATSTWCWDALHRGPDMRWHAEHHLASVRLAQR
jgi:Ser/Thr protein kinase RdoA (MazF antagonist)